MLRARTLLLSIVVHALLATAAAATPERSRSLPALPPGSPPSADEMAKVRDLPPGPPFVDADGRQVHLGYLWPRQGAPRWVLYVTARTYYEADAGALETIRSVIGDLPPVPAQSGRVRSAAPGGIDISMAVTGLAGVGAFLLALFVVFRPRRDDVEAPPSTEVVPAPSQPVGRVSVASLPRMKAGANRGRRF